LLHRKQNYQRTFTAPLFNTGVSETAYIDCFSVISDNYDIFLFVESIELLFSAVKIGNIASIFGQKRSLSKTKIKYF